MFSVDTFDILKAMRQATTTQVIYIAFGRWRQTKTLFHLFATVVSKYKLPMAGSNPRSLGLKATALSTVPIFTILNHAAIVIPTKVPCDVRTFKTQLPFQEVDISDL